MSRRIGVLTCDPIDKTKPKAASILTYCWDLKNLAQSVGVAQSLAPYSRMPIVEAAWCSLADVSYDPALPAGARRVITYLAKKEKQKLNQPGSAAPGYTENYRAVLFFRQTPFLAGRDVSRRIGIPAPIFDLFEAGQVDRTIGESIAQTLSQATGLAFVFRSGYLRSVVTVIEER